MTTSSRRILVVDDDPASCELVAYFLKSLGYSVAIAPDGNRALSMDLDDDIELVILDVHMPEYEGPEVLAMLHKRRLARPLKVLAVTGDESEETRQTMDGLGVDGFLTKPLHLPTLHEHVSRLMPGQAQSEGGLHRRVRERGVERRLEERRVNPRAELRGSR